MARTAFADDTSGIASRGRLFVKMHGLRNDIIFVDARRSPYAPAVNDEPAMEPELKERLAAYVNLRKGIEQWIWQ